MSELRPGAPRETSSSFGLRSTGRSTGRELESAPPVVTPDPGPGVSGFRPQVVSAENLSAPRGADILRRSEDSATEPWAAGRNPATEGVAELRGQLTRWEQETDALSELSAVVVKDDVRAQPRELPKPRPLTSNLLDEVLNALGRAASTETPYSRLRDALHESAIDEAGRQATWRQLRGNPEAGLASLREDLSGCRFTDESTIRTELWALERELVERHGASDSAAIEMRTDPKTGSIRLRWSPTDTEPADPILDGKEAGEVTETGLIVVVSGEGTQIGERNEQVNVFVDIIDNPKIDLGGVLDDPEVWQALDALGSHPRDTDLRHDAACALSTVRPESTQDWTASYTGTGTVQRGPADRSLNGTVVVIKSRATQIGDYCYQENRIITTLSPTVDAAMVLAGNPELVDRLIDVACGTGARSAMASFEDSLSSTLNGELAQSPQLDSGRGRIERPPGAGRTLRVEYGQGVTIGEKVTQHNRYRQEVELGRAFRKNTQQSLAGIPSRTGPEAHPGLVDLTQTPAADPPTLVKLPKLGAGEESIAEQAAALQAGSVTHQPPFRAPAI